MRRNPPDIPRSADLKILEALHMQEALGMPMVKIAARLGVTKGAVAGMINRARNESSVVPCKCKCKENKDGGMPLRWWAA